MLKKSIFTVCVAAVFVACSGGGGKGGADAGTGGGGNAGGAAGQGGSVGDAGAPGGRGGGAGGVGGDAAPGGGGGGAGTAVGGDSDGSAGAGGQGGGCPAPDSASIYPAAACSGGTNCVDSNLICDCVSSQWKNCRVTSCPSSTTGPLYPCMSGVTLPANCSCKLMMPQTQAVPYCVCNQT